MSVVIPVDGPIGIKIESEKEMETVTVNDRHSITDEHLGNKSILR